MKLFNLFKKKKKAIIPIENEISKALKKSEYRDIGIEMIIRETDLAYQKQIDEHVKRIRYAFNIPPRFMGVKRTQSVSDKIGARKRKGLSVTIKHAAKQSKTDDLYFNRYYGNFENVLIISTTIMSSLAVRTIDCPDND